jgi:hypothetical protein
MSAPLLVHFGPSPVLACGGDPIEFGAFPHFLPLLGLMTSRDRGEKAVPLFTEDGVGIAPTVELSVVIGMGIPVLSFPRFHGFGQTNRTS